MRLPDEKGCATYPAAVKELEAYIREGLAVHGYRNVFDNRLDVVWPLDAEGRKKQAELICAFAARHGWRVVVCHDGKMATFRPGRKTD